MTASQPATGSVTFTFTRLPTSSLSPISPTWSSTSPSPAPASSSSRRSLPSSPSAEPPLSALECRRPCSRRRCRRLSSPLLPERAELGESFAARFPRLATRVTLLFWARPLLLLPLLLLLLPETEVRGSEKRSSLISRSNPALTARSKAWRIKGVFAACPLRISLLRIDSIVEPRLLSSCPMMLATRVAVRNGPVFLLVALGFSFEDLPRVLLEPLLLAPVVPHDVATPASPRLRFILMERSSRELSQRNVSVSRDVSPVRWEVEFARSIDGNLVSKVFYQLRLPYTCVVDADQLANFPLLL